MRTVSITADSTASMADLRDGCVLALSAGVDLTLPKPTGDCRVTVRALGANCSVISAAGIELGTGTSSTSAVPLASGETIDLYAGYSAGVQSGWKLAGPPAAHLSHLGVHAPARVCTSGAAALPSHTADAGVLTADADGALTIDGVAVAAGDRVLVNEASAESLIYVVTDPGAVDAPWVLTPAADSDSAYDLVLGALVAVYAGSARSGVYMLTTWAGTYGTSALTWTAV